MDTPIRNTEDLKLEIARLKGIELDQAVELKLRFSSPMAIISTAMSLFPKSPTVDGVKNESFFSQDFVGLLSRIVLPLTLNKTLFRHSNFLVKTLVGILSQKASHYISEDSVQGIWGKAKTLFAKFTQKNTEGKTPVTAYAKS